MRGRCDEICVNAGSGREVIAAAPPTSVMKSRRLMDRAATTGTYLTIVTVRVHHARITNLRSGSKADVRGPLAYVRDRMRSLWDWNQSEPVLPAHVVMRISGNFVQWRKSRNSLVGVRQSPGRAMDRIAGIHRQHLH